MKKHTAQIASPNKDYKLLTSVTAFFACFMMFTSVFYYVESIRLEKKNQELELRAIELEGEVQSLRNKRMLDSLTNKKPSEKSSYDYQMLLPTQAPSKVQIKQVKKI